jgi:hypothetical protein
MTGRAIENSVARGSSTGGMRGCIMFPQIRFCLNDAPRERTASAAAHQNLSQE